MDEGEAVGVRSPGDQRRRVAGEQVADQAGPVGFQLVAGRGQDVVYARRGNVNEALDKGSVVDGRGGLGQSRRTPPMGVQRRQPLGQGQAIGQCRRPVSGDPVRGRQVVEQQVIAPLPGGVGGVVAAHQRRAGHAQVVAGVVGHFRRAERLLAQISVDHLQEQARRQLALRAGGVVEVEHGVG